MARAKSGDVWFKAKALLDRDGQVRGWSVDYRLPGQNTRHKSEDPATGKVFATERAANRWAATLVTSTPVRVATVTFGDYLARYLAANGDWSQSHKDRMNGIATNYLIPRWGHEPIGAIHHSDVKIWLTGLADEEGITAPSVRKILHLMRPVFALAIEDHGDLLVKSNPCAGIKITDGRPAAQRHNRSIATVEEVNRLVRILRNPPPRVWGATSRNPSRREQEVLAAASARDRLEGAKRAAMVLVMYWCGPRWGEVIGLVRGDVDFARHVIWVPGSWGYNSNGWEHKSTKGGEPRFVPMPGVVEAALREHLDRQPPRDGPHGDLVFPGERSRFAPRLMRNRDQRQSWLDDACAAAGLPAGWSPNRFRHTAGTNAWAVSPRFAQELLGHRQQSTTEGYVHRQNGSADQLRAALDQLHELSTRTN